MCTVVAVSMMAASGHGASLAAPAPLLVLGVDGTEQARSGPAIIVLWASWCPSCIGELKRLPILAKAAGPIPIVTLAIDPPERARRALEQAGLGIQGAFADPGEPAAVLAKWGGTALPLAVAIDARGQVCGRKRGLLGTEQMKQWAKACLN